MRSLHFKIALFIILTILIIFGSYSAYQIMLYQSKFTEMQKESSELLGLALTSSLEIAMVNSNLDGIQHSFEEIAENQDIIRVFLLNMSGEVRASSEKKILGTIMSTGDEGCHECHMSASGDQLPTAIVTEQDEALRVVVPIKNKPACFRCHKATDKLNGLLILDRSLRPIKSVLYSSITTTMILAAISVLGMMLLFRWFIKKQVINRVAHLESLARRVVNNEFDLDLKLSGNDELTSLAHSFNQMKTTLRLSIERIESHRLYLTNLLNNLVEGILIVDDNNKIVFINKSMGEVLELDSPELKPGNSMESFLSRDSQIAGIGELINRSRERNEAVNDVIKLHLPRGQEKYLEVHTGRLVLPPRRKQEVIVVIKDVTDVLVFEKKMYLSEKLATVGRLAAGVAHEINNPMASILTCAEGLLKSEQNDRNKAREYLIIIKNSAQRCKMITQKLLDFSAESKLKKESVDIDAVLNEVVALLQFEGSKKTVSLTFNKKDAIPVIIGSRDSLMQVFVNLTLNSIQAVDVGGKIEIVAETNDNRLDIFINDNGAGINSDMLEHVFEPFFTTKLVGTGTGLGLSVSQGIIKQHGGQIEIVESRKGHTSVKVSLPLSPDMGGKNSG